MKQKNSAYLGLVGGAIDLVAGWILLQPAPMSQTVMIENMHNAGPTLLSLVGGYFLIALGVLVLSTSVYLLSMKMMARSRLVGWLMIVYGIVMLFVAASMFAQLFSMMQGAYLSGALMLTVGLAMLYSGFTMKRT